MTDAISDTPETTPAPEPAAPPVLPSVSVPAAPASLVNSLVNEVRALEARLFAAEQALASLAAPTLSQVAHDGYVLLSQWYEDFKHLFSHQTTVPKPPIEPKA